MFRNFNDFFLEARSGKDISKLKALLQYKHQITIKKYYNITQADNHTFLTKK